MKKTLFVALVVVALLVLGVSSAFASGYKTDTGWSADDARHAGYDATSNACKACHDVHGAQEIDAAGNVLSTSGAYGKLYRWDTVSAGCDACHLGASALSTTQVYTSGAPVAEHTITATNLYDSAADAGIAAGGVANQLDCFDCHNAAPHGVDTSTGNVATNNLIAGYNLATDAGINSYCGTKCHDLNDGDATSHSLAAADNQHAFSGAEGCTKCHTSGADAAQDFPHQDTADYVFLGSNTLSDSALDAKCVSCHISGTGTSGVGLTY